MVDGRIISADQAIPIASGVGETKYCIPSSLNSNAIQADPLRLLCAGREKCLPGYHVERTDFHCRLVELVVSGKGTLRINGETHDIFPGIVFSYGMDTPHDMWTSVEDPMTKYFAAFQVDGSQDEVAGLSQKSDIRWTRDQAAFQVLFDELIREGQRDGALHQEITSAYLKLILLKAAEALPHERIPQNNSGKGRDVFERALSCIEANFRDISTLDELSSRVGVDPNYICRLFKRFGNDTPIQCLSRCKLNHAAELLLSRKHTVAEIAGIVGYSDPFYFSKVFKKRFGKSPTEFRGGAK